jgi:hypothetical protein
MAVATAATLASRGNNDNLKDLQTEKDKRRLEVRHFYCFAVRLSSYVYGLCFAGGDDRLRTGR